MSSLPAGGVCWLHVPRGHLTPYTSQGSEIVELWWEASTA